ncbi:hypothetical protein Ae201684_018959 [Aphanomyces euteiches]|uniref:DDE Tnp4 domain-containing protein n=1 Tax=Aphanomyces euteiches TaxID=100861 RepID=A0A6G0W435_9STRA|nr:hypothetical protein Ae201684_018959 [Aphanomyces euteiches]
MPRQGERISVLRGIEGYVKQHLLQYPYPPSWVKKQIRHLLGVYRSVLSVRYLQQRCELTKSLGALSILPHLSVNDFEQEVRVSQDTFAFILGHIENSTVFANSSSNTQASDTTAVVLLVEWWGEQKELAKEPLSSIQIESSKLAMILQYHGSNGLQLQNDIVYYQLMERILYCLKSPTLDGEVYYSRKKTYSMNTILTFDFERQIRYVVAGWPGSVHDSTIWKTTDVC